MRRPFGWTIGFAMVIVGLVAAPAVAKAPIKPNQHFIGLVNGKQAGAVVKTICPGPEKPGTQGRVLSGQTLSVRRQNSGSGYTGPFGQVNAWFVPSQPWPAPVQLRLTEYGKPMSIPRSVHVPCSGSGQVEFSSCPYLAPCAYGWVPTYVKVRFVNVAA
jgi:hypothetical protein